jgi:hypothetical protein
LKVRFGEVSRAAAVVAALGLGAAGPLFASGAKADAPNGSYTTTARADAFRIGVSATGFIVSSLTDTSGPTAQARVDSLGTSVGFAALPYPGDTIVGAPGLVASLVLPQLRLPPPNLPSYPLVASSQYPGQPAQTVTRPPVSLIAESTSGSSSGHAKAAGSESGANAIGRAVADATAKAHSSDELVADAASMVESVTISGVLRIGRVVATAHASSSGGGAPAMRSSFSAEGMTIAGVPVEVTEKGLVLAGSTVPVPPASSAAQALAASGIDVQYLAPVTSPGAVRSAGFAVSVALRSPTGNRFTVAYTFGIVQAGVGGSPGSSTSPGPAPFAGVSAPVAAAGGAVTSAPTTTAADAGGIGLAQGGALPQTGGLQTVAAPSADVGSSATAPTSTTSALSLYLVLAVGAAVALSGSLVLRHFAVRFAWTS